MSLPTKLLKEFDVVLHDRGYQSRSKGIRDALKDYILRYQWMNEMEGEKVGTISVIYNRNVTGVMENLTDAQHEYRQNINAVMHIHMTEKKMPRSHRSKRRRQQPPKTHRKNNETKRCRTRKIHKHRD